MTALEIFLLFMGLACIVVSFVMPARKEGKHNNTSIEPELSEFQLEVIKNKVEEAVEQEVENVVEKTEISLDKISNTKILEMQEYANTIFSEMNRNHNETMFLYDMLNDKSKDIKSIVRELNLLKQKDGTIAGAQKAELESMSEQGLRDNDLIEKLFIQAAEEEEMPAEERELVGQALKETAATTTKRTRKSTKASDTTTTEKKRTTSTRAAKKESVVSDEAAEESKTAVEKKTTKTTASRGRTKKAAKLDLNGQILAMHEDGKTVLEIAKALNLGVGQTKLVIDLFEGQK